jgi:hypothetical protein
MRCNTCHASYRGFVSAKLIVLKVSFAVSIRTLCNVHFELGNNLRLIIDIYLINLKKCVREDT